MAPGHRGFALSPDEICTLHAVLSASVDEQ
jgi:hypothetical protein